MDEKLTNIHLSEYNETRWKVGSSKYKNLKELRCETEKHVLRVAYYFDTERKAFLLIGGDKKGKNQIRFYRELIRKAEKIIKKHEQEN